MTSNNSKNLMLGILLALLLLGFGLDRLGYMQPVRILVQSIFQPAQSVVTDAASQVSDATQRAESLEKLQSDNVFLQAEVNRLLVENVQLRELERENKELRALLNYTKNNPDFDYTSASVVGRVIGADPSNLLYTIFIDVGVNDGVTPGMPVITHRGLVGRVTQVSPNSAQVLLIIDPASSVNALVQNSRVHGIVRGELAGGLLMERIPQGEKVTPGDLVLTSGLGGAFPNKLVIGQITEVFQRDLDLFQSARIRSTVDFGGLETVLVLTAFQPIDLEGDLLKTLEGQN